jgi:hypothetical protein
LLHDEISSFIDHGATLIASVAKHTWHHSASAPEMISISSLVIIAWRVRL